MAHQHQGSFKVLSSIEVQYKYIIAKPGIFFNLKSILLYAQTNAKREEETAAFRQIYLYPYIIVV